KNNCNRQVELKRLLSGKRGQASTSKSPRSLTPSRGSDKRARPQRARISSTVSRAVAPCLWRMPRTMMWPNSRSGERQGTLAARSARGGRARTVSEAGELGERTARRSRWEALVAEHDHAMRDSAKHARG